MLAILNPITTALHIYDQCNFTQKSQGKFADKLLPEYKIHSFNQQGIIVTSTDNINLKPDGFFFVRFMDIRFGTDFFWVICKN